jgi:hypothetical protein
VDPGSAWIIDFGWLDPDHLEGKMTHKATTIEKSEGISCFEALDFLF